MTDDVLISVERGIGRLRLNRPKAIHVLTTAMCEAMSQALLRWRHDSNVDTIIIEHGEGRGFCAGGDVVMLARSGHTDSEEAKRFFFAEYRLNHLLFTYPKPTVAIMDGITMGGGVGISLPCTYRVATENTRFSMPETSIGLFPDVGGGWYLPRLPGRVGEFMALTGARLDGAECHYLGLATHYVEQAALPDMIERIATTPQRVQGPIGAFAATAPDAKIEANLPAIGRCFATVVARHGGGEVAVGYDGRLSSPELEAVKAANKAMTGQMLASSLLAQLCQGNDAKMEAVLSALIDRTKFAYVPLEYYDIDRQVVRMLPDDLTINRLFVPFDLVSRTIMVAVCNPFDAEAREAVQQSLDYTVNWYLAKPAVIIKTLQEIYKLESK